MLYIRNWHPYLVVFEVAAPTGLVVGEVVGFGIVEETTLPAVAV